MKIRFYKAFLLLAILMTMNSLSCERDNFRFPYVPVNVYAGLYSDLANLGSGSFGFYYPNEGLNGLIIYRSFDNQYYVFDRTCTYEPELDCATEKDPENSFLIRCPCCKSQYLIDDTGGSMVFKGPARHNLVEYNAVIEGSNLHIFN